MIGAERNTIYNRFCNNETLFSKYFNVLANWWFSVLSSVRGFNQKPKDYSINSKIVYNIGKVNIELEHSFFNIANLYLSQFDRRKAQYLNLFIMNLVMLVFISYLFSYLIIASQKIECIFIPV